MTIPQRVITFKVVVKGGRVANQDLEAVASWAEDALCDIFNTEGYDVKVPKHLTITDLRGEAIRFEE